ncbi:MAG: lysine--tRNA ligase [Candidatus ainarchaeum sp.]|nr:lysine--tRNA ligase [Candidatus ainarchaeum sp.]
MESKGRGQQIVDQRLKKIADMNAEGIESFPSKFEITGKRVWTSDIIGDFSKLKNDEKSGKTVVVAGRMMTKREFGKLNFVKLQDFKGFIQVIFQKDETPEKTMALFKKTDAGDIIGVKGEVMQTKTGELSVLANELQILSKSILPLPDKFHGLKDEEDKFRKRYLDIIMDQEVKELFVKKQIFWGTIRNFLVKNGFLEVETPVLENSAGGASAEPFKTHHNALDINVYLRISMGELWQKRLLVAGYEKTFELGRQFRNEGMDMEHLQDYTQMEFYWGYANYDNGMELVEEMYKEVTKAVLGTLKFESKGYKVDMSKKWEKYDFEKVIKEKTGIDIYKATEKEIKKKLDELGMVYDPKVDKWRLIDVLWKHCRKQLSGPGFLVGQPVELSPLAKRKKEDPRKVEQFQVILAGSEIGNGYSELNDPIDQEGRFERQAKLKAQGDVEAQDHDKDFIEALKYGMPPACGFGVSERLFATLMNRPMRECVIFPLLRPEGIEVDDKKVKK